MSRKIMHVDLDAFFCSVEELRDPSLKEKPFIVGHLASERGVVLSASYAARKWGVHSAMPTIRAVKLLPNLIIVHPRFNAYRHASYQVMQKFNSLTPLVEQISIDEAFLDVSDLPGSSLDIARQLQSEIHKDIGLPCSMGLASNKLVAKIATNIGKVTHHLDGPPCSILDVPPGHEEVFLRLLPIQALWGVGPKTALHMESLGIHTIGDLVRFPEKLLEDYFGKFGHELRMRACGVDDRPIETSHLPKSISQERTFEKDVSDQVQLLNTLRELSQSIGYRLRHESLSAMTIRIKIRWSDFTTLSRQTSLKQATDQDKEIIDVSQQLFEQTWKRGQHVRLIGVGVTGLKPPVRQLNLWDSTPQKEQRLLEALDNLRERFGDNMVQRGYKGRRTRS